MIAFRKLGFAAVFGLSAAPALAADLAPIEPAPMAPMPAPVIGGFYLGTISSVTFPDNTRYSFGGAGVSTDYDVGFYTGGRIGYGFSALIPSITPRIEVEAGYGTASVDKQNSAGIPISGSDSYGDVRSIQGYVNGYLDLNLGGFAGPGFFTAFSPYVGGGVGAAYVELHKQGFNNTGVQVNDSDTNFAYHLDAGIGIELAQIGFTSQFFSGTTFDVGYRYTDVPDLSFKARDGSTRDTDFTTNAVTFGFRKQF